MERDEERLADLLLHWEELQEQGRNPPATELCRDCPHLAEELASRIRALSAVAWLDKPIDPPTGVPAQPDDSPQHGPQTLAGRYRLDTLIAEGGFAQVWRGFDQELHRHVAIKLPKRGRIQAAEAFIAEARRVAKLKHPAIVSVHDAGRDSGVCFIVSELVEGGSLDQVIRTQTYTQQDAVGWVAEIAEALQHAHANHVVHQDVKPANILINQHRRALLTDFGFAPSRTKTGTLRYMSPEQLEGHAVDARTDIYSLGVVLHELLSGSQPYSSAEPNLLRREILDGVQLARLPTEYRRICEKALNRNADARYETAEQMAADLRRVSLPRARSRVLFSVTLLVLAFLTPLAWNSWKPHPSTPPPNAESQVGEIRVFEGGPQFVSIALSPDGRFLVTGELFYTVGLWDVETGARIRSYEGLKDWVRCVACSPDGKWIVAGSGGNDDGNGRLVVGPHNLIIRWDIETGDELQRFGPIDSPVTTVSISADGDYVLAGSGDGIVRLWDIHSGQEKKRIEAHSATVRSVQFVPGKPWALSAGGDSMVRLWDLDSGEELKCFAGHKDTVESVAISSNGRWIASGGKDNTVRIWDIETGAAIQRLDGHAFHVKSVCFSPDDRTLLSGAFDGTIRLWDVSTGGILHLFLGHENGITSVAFLPDGKRAVSGSVDGTSRLWGLPH